MTKTQYGMICFLALLIFATFFIIIFRTSRVNPETKFQEVLRAYREAHNWHERLFILFIVGPYMLEKSLALLIALILIAGFYCLAGLFGDSSTIKTIQRKIYDLLSGNGKLYPESPRPVRG
jgi:hypothetical protein